ncbi:uncharacterized protein BCR38DRAFT_481782 [Pseudomassariella vexata]|uniref:Uncharacterized protein n=1 Tax=Pseudomassariella vexata TaxID=1141098 RepID=A0A1Y2E9Q8_9PEZI|nr:uncharacterized protein BCR38DRAFT_481782 [Pseudomassariella vexata]ORY68301.1 hypothetical protein BCR38DRAFT_481782 [Pseudomassariella vexata]
MPNYGQYSQHPKTESMTKARSFWTTQDKFEFHLAVEELHKLVQVPADEHLYRDNIPEPAGDHVLALKDELQIADNLAFLAHWEEDVTAVSAITIQERPRSLKVVVTSNQTPAEAIVDGLRDLMRITSEFSQKGTFNESYLDKSNF